MQSIRALTRMLSHADRELGESQHKPKVVPKAKESSRRPPVERPKVPGGFLQKFCFEIEHDDLESLGVRRISVTCPAKHDCK